MNNPNPYPNTPNSISTSSSSSSSSSETNPSKMAENQKPHKKQVRRRLHTTRPYQERLMNMAEARREIVTALKHHRAAMRNAAAAAGATLQSPPDPPPPPPPPTLRSQERKITRQRKIPKSTIHHDNNHNLNLNLNLNLCYPWMMMEEGSNNLEMELPEQTLGLNLNLKNLDASLFSNGGCVSEEVKSEGGGCGGGGGGVGHVAVGEEEMAEIRSIGEKHSVEWSDKMSMVKSAWWLKFMEMEESGFEFEFKDPFDQILEFPDWINNNNNGNQMCFDQQQFFSADDYHHPSSALPW